MAWSQFGSKIAVEPVMFLYMFAFMTTSVVEEAFFVYKACRVNLNFSEEICRNISSADNAEYKTQVQIVVSTFHQYESIAANAVPIFLAFFLGSWSDQVGRKLPMILGLTGSLIYSLMIILNSYMDTWPVETIIYTACLPCALTGGSLSIFMAAFSYLADTTSQESRTKRTTLLEVAYLFPMPTGVLLGSYLFYSVFNQSYGLMFVVNATFLTGALFATFFLMEWKTSGSDRLQGNSCMELISLKHVSSSVKALIRRRPERRRLFLWLALIAMAFYTFQRDEKSMVYLYTQYKFDWDVRSFSLFRTFQSFFFVVGLLLGVPLLSRCGLPDALIIVVGALSHISGRIFFAAAPTPLIFYIGAFASVLGPITAPVLRSFVSKLVPFSDRGKIFALFTIADTAVPLLSGIIYSQVYNATITSCPQAIFYVTILSQIVVLLVAVIYNILLKGKNISQAADESRIMTKGYTSEDS